MNCAARDTTQFAAIFGHLTNSDAQIDWPGYNGLYPTVKDASKAANNYFAAQFTVPVTLNPRVYGSTGKGETYGNHPLTFSISPTCGDFDNVPNPTLCKGVESAPVDTFGVQWKNLTNTSIAGCPLVPGQTYYLNIKFTTPPTDSSNCTSTSCYMPLSNIVGLTDHL